MANIVLSILGTDRTGPATKSAEANLSRVQQLAKQSKMFAVGVGVAAAGAVGAVLKTGFDEAKDGSAGMAQLEAGIKSTGGAAGVSVGHMEDLASSIQSMSGQTDDSIVKTESLLQTFTNIKNQGPNKIFDEATLAAANMAAKMGGDASQQAIILGKALNDPAAGLSKLTKIGVTFTDAQKAQVAAMVKSGDTAGAQKVILGELSKEFGGAAKAAGQSLPGQMARAQRSFEDLSQGVVEALLPIMSAVLPSLISGIKAVSPVLQDVAKWITENKGLLPFLAAGIGVVTVAFWALSLTPVTLMFAGIVAAVVVLIAVVVLLVTHWNDIVGFFRGVWAAVTKWFTGTLHLLGASWNAMWSGIATFFRNLWNGLVAWFTGLIRAWVGANVTLWHGLVNFLRGLWDGFVGFFRGIWNGLVNFGVSVVRGYISTARGLWSGIISWLRGLLNGYLGFWRNVWSTIVSFVAGIPRRIMGVFSGMGTMLYNSGKSLINGFIGGITASIGGAVNAVSGVVNAVAGFFPHSPAKEGPFSGQGWTEYSGAALIDGFATGAASRAGGLKSTVSGVLGSLVPALSLQGMGIVGAQSSAAAVAAGGGAGTGGGVNIGHFHAHANQSPYEIAQELGWMSRMG